MENEKITLSKREKNLLFGGICFAILALMIILVIIPLANSHSDKTDEFNRLALEKTKIEIALATEAKIRGDYDNELATFNHLRTIYSSDTVSSDIGLMLTEIVIGHGLTPISQSISPPEDFIVPIDGQSVEYDGVFSKMTVTMVLSGSYGSVKALLNTIEESQYIRISNVALVFSEDEYGFKSTDRINIKFEVLMLREQSE